VEVRLRTLRTLRVDPSSGSRIAGVEGLRALAAGSILVFHVSLDSSTSSEPHLGIVSRWLIPQLPLGVTLFFVLSGFLLYRPFVAALMRGQERPSISRYLGNRALRIFPAYLFILVMVALVLQTALVYDAAGRHIPGRLDDPGVLAKNAVFLQNYDTPWKGSFFTGIGPAWSLAVEAVFYVALPLLVLGAYGLASGATTRSAARLACLAPAGLLLVVGLVTKLAIYLIGPTSWEGAGSHPMSTVLYWSFLGNADKFAFGMAVAVLYVNVQDELVRPPRWWPPAVFAAILAVAIPTAKFTTNNAEDADPSNYAYNTLMALACALLLALVVLPRLEHARGSLLVRVLETRPLVVAGLVSYSVFLWHEPVIYWLRRHDLTQDGATGFGLDLLLVGAVVGVLSSLTYRFIELPALRRKTRGGARVEAPAPQLQAAP
jgi:peptidoglycan/LPS O-acetylase OafA/YrhL